MSVKTKAWIASCATSGSGVWTSDMGVLGVTLEARLSWDHRDNDEEAEELTEPDRARLTCQSWIAMTKRGTGDELNWPEEHEQDTLYAHFCEACQVKARI